MSDTPPKRAPGDRSHLERLVQELSVEEGIAAARLRRWVSTQVLLGALARGDDDERRFVLKGGVAMELRLRLRARATKDIDIIVITQREDDLIDTLQDALEESYLDFGFRLARIHGIGNTPAHRMDVKMTYKGKPWATLRLEASPPEAQGAEVEEIAAFSLTQLGLLARVAEACRDIFTSRAKQSWPPQLAIEPSWPEQYRALAIEQAFAIQEVAEAAQLVTALIDEIGRA